MQTGSLAVSTLNRITSAVLDESRLFLGPLSSFVEYFCEEAALSGFRTGSIWRFNDDAQCRRFSILVQAGTKSRPKYFALSHKHCGLLLQKSQTLSSTRLSAAESPENGTGNRKAVSEFGADVVHLNEKNFDDVIKGSLVAVLYHAAWCKMCKILKPVWRSVSQEVAVEKYPVTLAAVDVAANPELGIRENITHLPAVKLYGGGHFLRNVPTPIAHKDLIELLKNPMKADKIQDVAVSEVLSGAPGRVEHLTSETLFPFLKKTPHALVLFHQKGETRSAEALEHLKIATEDIEDKSHMSMCAVCCDDNAEICTQLGVFEETVPHLRYFHFLMRKQLYYSGDFTSASMLEFMRTSANTAGQGSGPKLPDPDSSRLWQQIPNHNHVVLLNDATFDRAIEIQPQLLVLFYAAWCRHCANVKPVFAEAAAELSKLGFPKRLAACELVANSRVSQMQNIEFVPSFRLFEQGKPISDHHSLRTKEEFVRLILDRNKSKS